MTDSNAQIHTDSTYNLFPASQCSKFPKHLNALMSYHVNFQGFKHCSICFQTKYGANVLKRFSMRAISAQHQANSIAFRFSVA